jgi:hypothetical protein
LSDFLVAFVHLRDIGSGIRGMLAEDAAALGIPSIIGPEPMACQPHNTRVLNPVNV